MKITVVGTGYVGLVTGACFADTGNDVVCVDIDVTKIENLKKGIIPIYEPGLEEIVRNNAAQNRLEFTTDLSYAVNKTDIIFIAVGTPPDEDGSADLSYVLKVATDIATYMNDYKIIVDKSTVPVGTGDLVHDTMAKVLAQRGSDIGFDVVSNPEFLKEGAAVQDFLKPDRVVIGVESPKAVKYMRDLYSTFSFANDRVQVMSIRSAEMTKYAANSMLALKISFMNELSHLCDAMGADINEVRLGIGSDTRIGYKFIYPGVGYGGSCFPKDVKALVRMCRKENVPGRILEAVEAVNDDQKFVLANKVKKHFGQDLKGKHFAVWGLAFKPHTDDMREAPSRVIINELLKAGATITAYDPVAMTEAKRVFGDTPGLEYAESDHKALKDADALLLITEWPQFRHPDFTQIKTNLRQPVVFDGRNQYDPAALREDGFTYYCIGRPEK